MEGGESQFDYPVRLEGQHVAHESVDYDGDKFKCYSTDAYTHTGAWPTWNFCPYCGHKL